LPERVGALGSLSRAQGLQRPFFEVTEETRRQHTPAQHVLLLIGVVEDLGKFAGVIDIQVVTQTRFEEGAFAGRGALLPSNATRPGPYGKIPRS